MKSSSYCVLPFKSFSTNPSGEIRVCCNNGHMHAPYQKLSETEDVLNSKFLQGIREQFINNEKPKICDRCWKQEDQDVHSFRYQANNDTLFGIKDDQEASRAKSILSFEDIEYADISIGNHCNLACRMCNSTSSSLFGKEVAVMEGADEPTIIEPTAEEKKKIYEVLEKAVNLNTIYLLGGEPLITDLHEEILDIMIDSGKAKNVVLRLSTNLQTQKLDKFIEKWSQFRQISIQVSIDGYDKMYEYIRWPGKWSKLDENFKHLIDATKLSKRKLRPSIATTIQNINCHSILDLVKNYCMTNRYPVSFYFIPVTSGEDLFLTPKRTLLEVYKRQERLQHKLGGYIPLGDLEKYLVSALKREPTRDEAIRFFDKYKMFDLRRKQNLFEAAPFMEELAKQFKVSRW